MSDKDPLHMAGLDPINIAKEIAAKGSKAKPVSELDMKKEERLAKKEDRLTSGKAGPSGIPKPSSLPPGDLPPPPPDPSIILDKIEAYRERFPHVKSRNKVSGKSSVQELIDELHYIEMQLGSAKSGTGGSMGCMLLSAGMSGLEIITRDVWNPFGLNLAGLGSVTKDNMPQFEPIVDELAIKYGAGMYMSPELRLCLLVGSTVATVHVANSGDPRIAEALKKINKQVNQPESDL